MERKEERKEIEGMKVRRENTAKTFMMEILVGIQSVIGRALEKFREAQVILVFFTVQNEV